MLGAIWDKVIYWGYYLRVLYFFPTYVPNLRGFTYRTYVPANRLVDYLVLAAAQLAIYLTYA